MRVLDLVLGRAIANDAEEGERVGVGAGVAILGLDALASAAYGPEALLTVLLPLGSRALAYAWPLTLIIAALLLVLGASYRQTIAAYPNGGGAYTVTKENLGTNASVVAASALALDYVLNVAVAISAGVGALVSAVPVLLPHTVSLCLGVLALITIVNVRGVRTSGTAFSLPTYAFVACLFGALIVTGIAASHGAHPVARATAAAASPTAWLLLRAFANGCTAMTGVEAVSNGVPIFREPQQKLARRTLATIVATLVVLLVGIALACRFHGITATPPGHEGYESVLSQVVAAAFGRGLLYDFAIGSIVAVLMLSANTSFADFPRVCRMLAGDRFLPEPFVHRGRRLAFSHGILVLAFVSGVLILAFGGITDRLIPLFAVGALLAFTMSQVGMVAHWRKRRGERGATRSLVLNGFGATATAAAAIVVIASKLGEGAWVSILIVAATFALMKAVRRHYDFVARATATDASHELEPIDPPIAIVPMRRWDAVGVKALELALGFAPRVVVFQIITGDRDVDDLRPRWRAIAEEPARKRGVAPPELVVVTSQYRSVASPLVSFVAETAKKNPSRVVAVVVPELVERAWYQNLLHDHLAAWLRTQLALHGGPQCVVVSAPWHLREWRPERRLLRWARGDHA